MDKTVSNSSGVCVVGDDKEPVVIKQDSSVDVEKKVPDLAATEKEKNTGLKATDEEMVRLMHPTVIAGEFV